MKKKIIMKTSKLFTQNLHLHCNQNEKNRKMTLNYYLWPNNFLTN